MAILYVHWQREELKLEHPDALSPDEARALVVTLFESGKVPPAAATGQRTWGAEVQTTSGRYRVMIRRDTVAVEPAEARDEPLAGA